MAEAPVLTQDDYREREVVRLVKSDSRHPGRDLTVVAQRDHNWLSVIVVQYADGQVWTAWTDGPRADAERQTSLKDAMASFSAGINCDVESDYFE